MSDQALAIDIGTSGIRAQLLDLDARKVIRTCITARNPIPGANIMDHMSFAIQYGEELAHSLIADACRQLISALKPDNPVQMAVCGNPIQLSLFEGIGIADLAYAGENKIRNEGRPTRRRSGNTARTSSS